MRLGPPSITAERKDGSNIACEDRRISSQLFHLPPPSLGDRLSISRTHCTPSVLSTASCTEQILSTQPPLSRTPLPALPSPLLPRWKSFFPFPTHDVLLF